MTPSHDYIDRLRQLQKSTAPADSDTPHIPIRADDLGPVPVRLRTRPLPYAPVMQRLFDMIEEKAYRFYEFSGMASDPASFLLVAQGWVSWYTPEPDIPSFMPAPDPDLVHFWNRVEIASDRPDACWTWTGPHPNQTGAGGLVSFRGKVTTAARVAWLLRIGPLAPHEILRRNLEVCTSKHCIKPGHHRVTYKPSRIPTP